MSNHPLDEIDPNRPDTPSTEEESPPAYKRIEAGMEGGGQRNRSRSLSASLQDLDPKDNHAFILAGGCILILAVFCGFDLFLSWGSGKYFEEGPVMLDDFVEIIKYVITTSLGFFFATNVPKKDK